MSLINQALRKAQRDRTPNRMADPVTAAPAQSAPAGSSGIKPGLVIGLLLAVAVLVGLVAGLTVVLFKPGDGPTPQVAQSTAQEAPIAPIEPASDTPPTQPAEESNPPAEPIAQAVQPPGDTLPMERDTTSSVVAELRKAREAAEAKAAAEALAAAEKAAAEAKAAEEAAARAAAKPSQDIIDWLTNTKISGVKLSERGNKVIINGKSYDVGEYANYQLGLKVMIIQEKRVLFVDKNGKKYLKRL